MDAELDGLIRRLNETAPLSRERSSDIYRAHTEQMIQKAIAMADEINTAKELGDFMKAERPDLSILNQPEAEFRAELRSIDNDLSRQIEIVHEGLDHWFATGLIVPPYYAWRIAIILSKAKREDEERAFLAAWCRHFGRVVGGRFAKLAERARKRGVVV